MHFNFLLFLVAFSYHAQSQEYQIIYLNGSTSSGKSTLSHALQKNLAQPHLIITLDHFISMIPSSYNDWTNDQPAPGFSCIPILDDFGQTQYSFHIGEFGQKIREAFMLTVATLAAQGHFIIIEDVSLGEVAVNQWKDALCDCKVLWVGLTAPKDILAAREKARGDRRVGAAQWQACHVHTGVTYDLMIDTHACRIEENVRIIKDYLSK